jgi:hypothetical protein
MATLADGQLKARSCADDFPVMMRMTARARVGRHQRLSVW